MSETQLTAFSNMQPQPFNDSTVRTTLRHATQPYHEQLNQHLLLVGLTKTGYPLGNYRKLLCAYFHLYRALEDRINLFISKQACAFDYTARCKLPWLLNDLVFFQDNPSATENVPSRALALPDIDNIGQLIGVLYAIEGSTLGGHVISRCLISNYGCSQTKGGRFFFGYGESTMVMWQHFIGFMDSISGDEVQYQAAERAACLTFQSFKQVLDDYAR